MNTSVRLPDYVIVGMMKSGTSSLYQWLAEQPECGPAAAKEPDFFSRDKMWARGVSWYSTMFDHVSGDRLVGEASTSYTKPFANSSLSARRMATVIPDVRLIYVVRDPVERLRSHYRHEVRRARERRTFLDAISTAGNDYIALSRYHACLSPYIESFRREQICVVRFEDLFSGSALGWTKVLCHLGLPPRRPPSTAYNVTADKPAYTRTMLWLWQQGHYRRLRHRLPSPIRRFGRLALLRDTREDDQRLGQSSANVPDELTEPIWRDVERLEKWLGTTGPLWAHSGDSRRPMSAEGNGRTVDQRNESLRGMQS